MSVKILKEGLSPEVGPFYFIDGVVYSSGEPVRDLEPSLIGTVDSDETHYDYWKFYQSVFGSRNLDYDYYPRGRVVYDSKSDKYYLYADPCIRKDQNSLNKIIDEFNLPSGKVVVRDDDHYRCHNCNPEYIEVSENY